MEEGILAIAMIFSVPIVAILTAHHRKVLELKLKLRQTSEHKPSDEIAKLRSEMQDIRDTSTRFDLSFDNMLQRLEGRVERLEVQARVSGGERAVAALDEGRGPGGA
ncbi:MAG: hypothetical protein FJX72_12960 [Armatimonadetes bacterium]|nr:hypothetical protein [Armatimonadota bacterium]